MLVLLLMATGAPPANVGRTGSVGLPSEEGLDRLAAHSGLIPPPEVENARALRAQAGEAEAALRRIAGVRQVRVVRGKDRATVVLRHARGQPPSDMPAIRRLVSDALAGLKAGSVEVILSEAPPPPKPLESPRRSWPLGLLLGGACAALGGWVATRSVRRD